MIRVADIQRAVAEHYNLPPHVMRQPSPRERTAVNPLDVSRRRQEAIYLAVQLTDHSYSRLGQFFGGRDHSTIIHAVRAVENRRRNDAAVAGAMRRITRQLVLRRGGVL